MTGVGFADFINGPAPLTRPGPGTERGTFDATATLLLRRQGSHREQLVALMRDLRHEAAVAYPDLVEWDDFLDLDGKRPLTRYNYVREVALLLRLFPDTPFGQFAPEQINYALTKKPARSRYITRSIFNGWFEWGVMMDKVDRSPMRKVPKGKHPKRRPKDIFDEAEIALLEALPTRDGALLTLMFCSGMRKAGCRNLQRRDIDLNRKRMVVTEKGDKTRIVPLPPEALQAVADLDLTEGLNPTDYLWYCRPGGGHRLSRRSPIGDTTFDSWWKRVLAAAGVRYLNIHQTRHTYGQRLREKGAELEIRKLLMGHENIKTTDHYYGRVTVEDAAAVLAEVW